MPRTISGCVARAACVQCRNRSHASIFMTPKAPGFSNRFVGFRNITRRAPRFLCCGPIRRRSRRLPAPNVEIMEFGAGAAKKSAYFLTRWNRPALTFRWIFPNSSLGKPRQRLASAYPNVANLSCLPAILPRICAGPFSSPCPPYRVFSGLHDRQFHAAGSTRISCWPRRGFLRGGALLIGVDLVKDPAILHAAYNDAAGVTAAFNRNLLARANRELGANFDRHELFALCILQSPGTAHRNASGQQDVRSSLTVSGNVNHLCRR